MENELEKAKDIDVINYLDACLYVLKHELEGKKSNFIDGNKKITDLLLLMNYTNDESYILSILFANKTVPAIGLCHNIERGKAYRILKQFEKLNIISKTNTAVMEYFILDKSDPFKYIIENLSNEANKIKDVSIKIVELLKE